MKSLEQVNIENVVSDKKYLLIVQMYERYAEAGITSYIGTGDEVLEKIKQIFDYEDEDGEDWINFVEERNGDGDDYVEVFEIE
jgi:2-iminoacetate synthase ThiH